MIRQRFYEWSEIKDREAAVALAESAGTDGVKLGGVWLPEMFGAFAVPVSHCPGCGKPDPAKPYGSPAMIEDVLG
jgi:hypothetical protein